MYVIATVICPNFHFSVSPHVPFLNLLFEQIANSNEYLLAKIGVDTAENEPLEVWGKIIQYYSFVSLAVARGGGKKESETLWMGAVLHSLAAGGRPARPLCCRRGAGCSKL